MTKANEANRRKGMDLGRAGGGESLIQTAIQTLRQSESGSMAASSPLWTLICGVDWMLLD